MTECSENTHVLKTVVVKLLPDNNWKKSTTLTKLGGDCFNIKKVMKELNPIELGGGGGQKVPALTLSVNNFFDIEANATKLGDFS